MTANRWTDASKAFFNERATQIPNPDLENLCYVSGRDVRLWSDEELYTDLIDSIVHQVGGTKESCLLEVGCAAGFLAKGLSARVKKYIGIDVAKAAIRVAHKLGIQNAELRVSNGVTIPLPDNSVDCAICYFVFINFPSLDAGEPIIREMLRVVKPNGKILIGDIPDGSERETSAQRAVEVTQKLEQLHGPRQDLPVSAKQPWYKKLASRITRKSIEPQVVCYDFTQEEFIQLGARLATPVAINDIHRLSPYAGLRFNAVFTKTAL